MLGAYKVHLLGAFWARGATHSRTFAVAPRQRGRAGVQGGTEPWGKRRRRSQNFKPLLNMLRLYKVNISGAFWRRAAPHSRTSPVTPEGRGLRRRWGGQARVQQLAVGEWGDILPPKMMQWDQAICDF